MTVASASQASLAEFRHERNGLEQANRRHHHAVDGNVFVFRLVQTISLTSPSPATSTSATFDAQNSGTPIVSICISLHSTLGGAKQPQPLAAR
jgi:hypothetical protein